MATACGESRRAMPCPIARRLELAATPTTHAQLYCAVPEVPEERWKIQPDTKETGTPLSAAASGWLNWPEASLLAALTNVRKTPRATGDHRPLGPGSEMGFSLAGEANRAGPVHLLP